MPEGGDFAALAAAFGFLIARKSSVRRWQQTDRLALLSVFLGLNGIEFAAEEAEAAVILRDLAAGQVDQENRARWIGDNLSG